MATNIIAHSYAGFVVGLRPADGYVNATAMARAYREATGKRRDVANWLANTRTKETLSHLSSTTGIPVIQLYQVFPGSPENGGGTWIHPRLAVRFGIWLSDEFGLAVEDWVDQWAKGQKTFDRPNDPSPDLIAAAGRAILGGIVQEHLIQGAIAEATRKHYPELSPSIDEFKKLLPIATETAHSVTVTEIAKLYSDRTGIPINAVKLNKLLESKGLQRATGKKEPRWEPIGQGNEFAEMVLQTAKGRDRTCYQLRWFPSVIEQLA